MRAFIHTVSGRPFNEECASAQRGFELLGIEIVPFSNTDELELSMREDIVVGGMLVSEHALARFGIRPPSFDYPKSLSRFFGREIRTLRADSIKRENLPIFIKPVLEKDLPGIVACTEEDLKPFLEKGRSYLLYASEPVRFVSEWRCFVRHGQLIGASCYRGDATQTLDCLTVARMVDYFSCDLDTWKLFFIPAGYGLDVGVTDDRRTLLVEVNDGFALGSYGLNDVSYALLLTARWSQLMGLVDPLSRVIAPKAEGPLGEAMKNQGWYDRFYHQPGISIPAAEPNLPKWMWGIAANVREYPRNMTREQAKHRRKGTKHFAPGTLVWVLEESWDPWYRRVPVVGKKKGTHRYIRKIMSLDELENFRAKKVYSPTVISWMRGAREWIPNHGSGRFSSGWGEGFFCTNWGYEGAASVAELWNEKGADDQ